MDVMLHQTVLPQPGSECDWRTFSSIVRISVPVCGGNSCVFDWIVIFDDLTDDFSLYIFVLTCQKESRLLQFIAPASHQHRSTEWSICRFDGRGASISQLVGHYNCIVPARDDELFCKTSTSRSVDAHCDCLLLHYLHLFLWDWMQ